MKKFISARTAGLLMITIFALVIVFHLLVIAGIVPYNIVGGGRLNSRDEMIRFELIAIVSNLVMMLIVAIKIKLLQRRVHPYAEKIILWFMFLLFVLNTIGNLFAVTQTETIIFTPITALLAFLALRLAMEPSSS